MVKFNGWSFNILDKCKKCLGLNEIIQLKGGAFEYFCDCFPCKSTRISPVSKLVKKIESEIEEEIND